ncbi:MAG: Crp/Fnr family transcriptional regulator [Calditrichaeota bacterium]|nr:MAG: Crp/Fnr family transcriptional regulator [Calditrichota bacterium]
MNQNVIEKFPFLQNATQKALDEFREYALLKTFQAGEMLSYEGDSCAYFLIVISGKIRVYKAGITEREITLYRVNAYESCILTAFCILTQTAFPAFAVAETDVEVVLIPSPVFRDWVNRYEVWRKFMFNNLSIRLNEILHTIDKMAFQRLDARVASYLLQTANSSQQIKITHQQLAKEVGSSRVVVSRILESMAEEGLIALGRGIITIRNRQGLARLSEN